MNRPSRITLPSRPPEIVSLSTRNLSVEVSLNSPKNGIEIPKAWWLYHGPSSGESLLEPTPYLLSSWLLRTTVEDAADLISPYAKLELSKESKDVVMDERGRCGSQYGFRLVSLAVVDAPKPTSGPKEVEEFKLIAGQNPYMEVDDATALHTCVAAIYAFCEGNFRLREFAAWDDHFLKGNRSAE